LALYEVKIGIISVYVKENQTVSNVNSSLSCPRGKWKPVRLIASKQLLQNLFLVQHEADVSAWYCEEELMSSVFFFMDYSRTVYLQAIRVNVQIVMA
jgi:hypothetical protein